MAVCSAVLHAGDTNPGRDHARAAEAALAAGRHTEAIAEFEQAVAQAGEGEDAGWLRQLQGQLGGALLAGGQFESAEQVLTAAYTAAEAAGDVLQQASIGNNLGHLRRAQGDRQAALLRFRRAAEQAGLAGNAVLQAKARLAAAGLLTGNSETASQAGELLVQAWQSIQAAGPSRTTAWLAIREATLLQGIAELQPSARARLLLQSGRHLQWAADYADAAADAHTAAHAYSRLGKLYFREHRLQEALTLTDRGLFHAQQAQLPELQYRLQWQRGQILFAQDARQDAVAAYRRAVAILQSIRAEVAAGNNAVSAALREDAGPLFLALADLLLQSSDTEADAGRRQALLREARETVELVKTTELQDYFQDDCVAAVRERIRELDATIVPGTAVLYPIVFDDRTELLLGLQDGLSKHTVAIGRQALVEAAQQFRRNLEKRTTRQYLRQSRQLYDWLVRPLEESLAVQHIDTLVVVPGPVLRGVPVAAFHDGRDFLIRRYAVAMTPSLRLTDPRPIRRQDISLLLNGLTEARQGFPPLVHVSSELEAIHDLYGGKVFQDQSYRKARIQEELTNEQYSVVHFATHGQFAGKVSDSFILTWDGRMNMNDLEEFVGVSWFRKDNPVELLTLSACETAAGDDTAALGLASVAIKAGARSALASLWSINDQASSELMSDFYARLKDPDVTKAEALKLAQTAFLDDLRYKHPSYWAPFLLIGNWL